MKNTNLNKARAEITEYIIDNIEDYEGLEIEDLHMNMFNSDYFIIGTYEAKNWIEKFDTFEVIGFIKDYENDNFGEVHTNLSNPEEVANMFAYIIGGEIIQEVIIDDFDDFDDTDSIIEALEESL